MVAIEDQIGTIVEESRSTRREVDHFAVRQDRDHRDIIPPPLMCWDELSVRCRNASQCASPVGILIDIATLG